MFQAWLCTRLPYRAWIILPALSLFFFISSHHTSCRAHWREHERPRSAVALPVTETGKKRYVNRYSAVNKQRTLVRVRFLMPAGSTFVFISLRDCGRVAPMPRTKSYAAAPWLYLITASLVPPGTTSLFAQGLIRYPGTTSSAESRSNLSGFVRNGLRQPRRTSFLGRQWWGTHTLLPTLAGLHAPRVRCVCQASCGCLAPSLVVVARNLATVDVCCQTW